MAKFHDCLEIWRGSQIPRATQQESQAQNEQMTVIGNILQNEAIVEASCSIIQPNGAAAHTSSG